MKLVIEDDEGRRREVALDRDEITIGRREDNVVHLPDRNVSRRHARLLRKEGSLLLEDLRSANGTRVNGVLITEPIPLGNGDLIHIGDYGVALRPDGVPLEEPLPGATAPEAPTALRADVLADTAPHPLVPALVDGGEARRLGARASGPAVPPGAGGRRRSGWCSGWAVRCSSGCAKGTPRGCGARCRRPPLRRWWPSPLLHRRPSRRRWSSPLRRCLRAARAPPPSGWRRRGRRPRRATSTGRCGSSPRCGTAPTRPRRKVLRRTWRAEATAARAVQKRAAGAGPGSAFRGPAEAGAGAKQPGLGTGGRRAPRGDRDCPEEPTQAPGPDGERRRTWSGCTGKGKALYDGGNAGEAAGRFERCLALDRNHPRCHLMLATSYARGGDTRRAESHYRRFLELASADDPAVPRVKKFLEDSDAEKKARASSAMPQR